MEGQGQKRGVKAEWEGGAGENFPSVKADRKERFQGQMSCTLGRGQEERTVDASTVRAEDEWVKRLLQGKKNLAVGKPVQDLELRGCPEPLLSTQALLPSPSCLSAQVGKRFSFGPITLSNASALGSPFSSLVNQIPLSILCALRDLGRRQGRLGQSLSLRVSMQRLS